jgi:putative hydrolase of the HAD superfamily
VILRTEDLQPRTRWEKKFGLDTWELANLIFNHKTSKLASVGKASVGDIWKSVQSMFQLTAAEREALRQDFFAGDQIDQELVAFIRQLRTVSKTALITNAWPDIRHWLENEWQIADAFDSLFISAELGVAKPDPRIFQHALTQLKVKPEKSIFVDDAEENIEGAQQMGLQTILFQDPNSAIAQLHDLIG